MTQTRTPAGLAGTVDHVDAGDGWLVVRLMTRQALDREGEHMGHCLGNGGYDECAGDEDMAGDCIWSLRDPAGMSRATLHVRHRRVVMAKGKGNSEVGGKAARRLKALVAAFRAAGHDLEFNGETGIVVAPNGYTCREDQAPPEVLEAVRARHAARMHAGRDRLPECEARQPATRWHARAPLRRAPERDLLAMTADLPNPAVEVRREAQLDALSVRTIVTLRDGQVIEMSDEGLPNAGSENAAGQVILTLYGRILAVQPPRTVTHSDLTRGDVVDLPGYMVTDVTVTAGGEALREGEDYDVLASVGALEFKRAVPGEVTISYRPAIERRRQDVDVAHAFAEALHRGTGMPVYEWCERELRIEEPAVRIEATVEAPLQVRSVNFDEYVCHMQSSSLQVFMGLDTQDFR